MTAPTRVLAADDPGIIRALRERKNVEVVGLVSDGEQLLKQALESRPDIAVIDLALPRLDGALAISRLSAALPKCRLLVLTARHSDELVIPIVSAGASGYLEKSSKVEELGRAIDALARGEVYFDPQAIKVLAMQLVES